MPIPTKDPHPEISNHPAYIGSPRTLVRDRTGKLTKFDCEGCMSYGTGTGYVWMKDRRIEKHYHVCCAAEPFHQPRLRHPKFGDLSFRTQPPLEPATEPNLKRLCDVCNNPVSGFVYHGEGTRFGVHPCCVFKESTVKCSDVTPEDGPRILSQGRQWNRRS